MDNIMLIHDYFSSIPELEDPNTLESRCMLFIGQIGNTDLVEEVLTAIMNGVITFQEIAALPSITIFSLTKLLESKDPLFNLMSDIYKFVANKNILALLLNFHYSAVDFNYVKYLKFFSQTIGEILPHFNEKVKLNTDVSISVYKSQITEFINSAPVQTILDKYRNWFVPELKMDEFLNTLATYTNNQLFVSTDGNITFTNGTNFSILQLALFEAHQKNVCEPNAHKFVISKIESEMFQLLSPAEERAKLTAGTITLQDVYINALNSIWAKLEHLVIAGTPTSITTQAVFIIDAIFNVEQVEYTYNQDVIKFKEFMVDYTAILHAMDEEIFNV